MGSDAEDLGRTIHPHPTHSETVMFAGEMVAGTITDLPQPKQRAPR
jgi:dihydrolipoamide dehydrogenase